MTRSRANRSSLIPDAKRDYWSTTASFENVNVLLAEDGTPRYRDYADYIVNHERVPGVGLLAGWRGMDGASHGKGAPNPAQLERYIANGGFWREEIPPSARYYKMANRDYLEWATKLGFIGAPDPVVLQLYSETLQKFRLAAQGHGPVQPPEHERERVARYFDPMPIWYEPFEGAQVDLGIFPLSAVTPSRESGITTALLS